MSNPSVSIIILNYRRGKDVLECLESVTHIDYPGYNVSDMDEKCHCNINLKLIPTFTNTCSMF